VAEQYDTERQVLPVASLIPANQPLAADGQSSGSSKFSAWAILAIIAGALIEFTLVLMLCVVFVPSIRNAINHEVMLLENAPVTQTAQSSTLSDSAQVTTLDDGTRVVTLSDGTQIFVLPDGEVVSGSDDTQTPAPDDSSGSSDMPAPGQPDDGQTTQPNEDFPVSVPNPPQTDRERLITAAYSYQGVPYEQGGTTSKGLDFGAFTMLVYAKAGVTLPVDSSAQAKGEKPLNSQSELQPGDLVFFHSSYAYGALPNAIYLGDGCVAGVDMFAFGADTSYVSKVDYYDLYSNLYAGHITYRHIVLPDEKK